MKDEIKEILDDLKKTADNTIFVVAVNQEELDRIPKSVCKYLSINNRQAKILLDYITNLQEIEKEHKNCTRKHWQQKCAEHCVNEMIYKSRNEKANALLDEMLERAYIDGEYIMYDYSTSELLEVKQALEGEDKDVKD